ncbi:MAG: D-alanyl-D-alanine carboxypeptidase [Rhizobiaceae bacterium]|nr:D-alanyl-D-alanine carboxypeptidase [Rhizobiaceae bacterium]
MRFFRLLIVALALGALSACSTTGVDALSVRTPAPLPSEKYASIVVDGNTGRTIYQVDAGAPRYPASLTKMMTLYMLYEALSAGRVSMATEIPVSRHAATRPPSKLGLKAGSTVDVRTAINALSVKSANDVAAAVGEYLGGDEERFAAMMTAKARSIGMTGTVFRNASGLPDDAQRTTARDMALLGLALQKRFPQYFGNFSQRSFAYRGRTIKGHNRLIGSVEGVDGIKTGYIRASGFNVVTSVGRRGKRLIVVVMGGKTARERDAHVTELIERFLPSGNRRSAPVNTGIVVQPTALPPLDDDDLPGVSAAAPDVPLDVPPAGAVPVEVGDGVIVAQ